VFPHGIHFGAALAAVFEMLPHGVILGQIAERERFFQMILN